MSNIAMAGGATGTGTVTLLAPVTSTDRTLTLPDATGTVLTTATAGVPVNGRAFSAYLSSTQSVTGSTFTKVTLDTEEFDTNTNFASSRFTPTVAGYYQVNLVIYTSGAGSTAGNAYIYKNGANFKSGQQAIANNQVVPVPALIYLNGSSDYIEAYSYLSTAGGVIAGTTGNAPFCYFQAYLARAA